jgi:hypothetical protein
MQGSFNWDRASKARWSPTVVISMATLSMYNYIIYIYIAIDTGILSDTALQRE